MTDSMIDERRWWSKAILVGGVVAICCVLVGSIGVRIGLWPYGTGFMFLTGGAVLSVIGVFLGIIAYVVCLRQGLRAERSGILIGIVLGNGPSKRQAPSQTFYSLLSPCSTGCGG